MVPFRSLPCVITRHQKLKRIQVDFKKSVIPFYSTTMQSNCAQNYCIYSPNTFLVLHHPGGFNCVCNFVDIKEGGKMTEAGQRE